MGLRGEVPTETHPELAALQLQAHEIDALAVGARPEDWDRPTRCPPLSVRELLAHVTFSLERFVAALGRETDAPLTHDRVSWWGWEDDDAVAAGVVEAGQREAAARKDDEELVEWWRTTVQAALERCRETAPLHRLRWHGTFDRVVTAADLAATRVVELGVHGMDLSHATLNGERIDPKAADIVAGVLDGLLAEPLPKALGWDRRTYILTGTGRRRVEPNERYVLGPLADRFPLLR